MNLDRKELQNRIELILGNSSGDWCGCHEGGLQGYFPERLNSVTNELLALFDEYDQETRNLLEACLCDAKDEE